MKTGKELFMATMLKRVGGGERGDLLRQLEQITGMPFDVLLKNTFHLKGEAGVRILEIIRDDTLRHTSDRLYRRVKCAELINLSKPAKKKLSTQHP